MPPLTGGRAVVAHRLGLGREGQLAAYKVLGAYFDACEAAFDAHPAPAMNAEGDLAAHRAAFLAHLAAIEADLDGASRRREAILHGRDPEGAPRLPTPGVVIPGPWRSKRA